MWPIEASPAIAARLHWIQYSMVSGRVATSSALSVSKMLVQTPGRRLHRHETLSIEINGGVCGMQYTSGSPEDQLKIVLAGGNQLSIHRARPNDGYELDFQQPADGPLSLVIEHDNSKRRWQADGFWQLYLAEPEIVRGHLVALLELLHPSWQLAETGAEIEESLFEAEQEPPGVPPDRKNWSRLVKALGSARFSERENAERELYAAGQIVVPYLQSLDRTRLDAEQVSRIRSVVEALSVDYEDKADRVANWLSGDQRAWLSLLNRDEPSKRRAAAERLSRLLGEAVDFDANAPLEERRAQIGRLQTRLEQAREARPAAD